MVVSGDGAEGTLRVTEAYDAQQQVGSEGEEGGSSL